MVPSSIGPYRIIEDLGSGANGEVYLAEDTRLGRKVAIKTLSALGSKDLADARRWVLREARAAARLNHPNIASVYDVLESPDGAHIVMEYVRGDTLAARVREGALPPPQVLEIAIQLADALSEAHAMGVIHRDLKPANVVITPKGGVKVLDFGLAQVRAVEPGSTPVRSSRDFTLEGRQVGTPPYMPPEHLMGDAVEVRGDIYSLGVMLFELLTGRRPFQGADAMALTMAILTHATPRASGSNADVPPALDAIVFRAMSRMPQDRYASASELGADLRRLTAVTPAVYEERTKSREPRPRDRLNRTRLSISIAGVALTALLLALIVPWPPRSSSVPPSPTRVSSLVVLPLANMSGDPAQEYFADGMTEALISTLAKISGLRVISRTSAMLYKGARKRLTDIAKELGVDAVLEGSILSSAGRVRISAQLVEGATERQLWSNSFESDLSDVLGLQRDVARATAAEIRVALTPQEDALLRNSKRVNPEAFEASLKGRYFWNKRNRDGFLKGIEHFQRAIDIDPNYAPAYAGLADSYLMLAEYGLMPAKEGFPKAKAAAIKAVELDETLAEAHTSLGAIVEDYDWDWPRAEAEFKRAIELNSGHAPARQWYAEFLAAMGRFDEAVEEGTRARDRDPLSLISNTALGRIFYMARQYDRAEEQLRRALDLDSSFAQAHRVLGQNHEKQTRYTEAIVELDRARQLSGDSPQTRALLGRVYALSGQRNKAAEILETLKLRSKDTYVSPTDLARLHAGLGDRDAAIRLLQEAFEERLPSMVDLKVDPSIDELRSDPRFQQLLRRIGFVP
jgi:eukaryotic-like serine/threonine-protein kinase